MGISLAGSRFPERRNLIGVEQEHRPSREFNQDTRRAKKATAEGPVLITDRDKPAHVLLRIAEYQRLTGDPIRTMVSGRANYVLGSLHLYRAFRQTDPTRALFLIRQHSLHVFARRGT